MKVTRPSSTTDYTYDNAQNRTHLTTTQGNNLPTSATYTISVPASGAYAVNPLGHHSDADGDTLTVASVTASGAPKGTLSNTPTQITYTPNANQGGQSDSFTYTVSDGKGGIGTGTVTVNIQAVQPAPAAQPFSVAITPNSAGNVVNYSLPLSFTGGAPTSVTASTPNAGSTSISGTSILYSSSGWSGQTSLQYTGTNGAGTGSTATATISVRPVVADATSLTATAGQAKTVSLSSYAKTTNISSMYLPNGANTQKGVASISGTTLTYTPNPNTTGTDTFAYAATGAGGTSAPANITFNIQGCPVPIAGTANATVAYNSASNVIPLNLSGGAASSVNYVTGTSHGSVQPIGATMYYSPFSGYYGPDSFTYNATNACGTSNTATANITVSPPPNQPPVLVNDNISIAYQTPTAFLVLNNDSDPENDPLTVTSTSQPSHGYSWPNSNNTVTYGPNNGYSGPDSFTYTVSDGHGDTRTATINITVRPANNPPVANERWTDINQSTSITLDPRNGDVDPDNDPLTVTGLGGFYFAYGRLNGVDINSSSPQAPSNIGSRSFTGSSMTYNAPFVSNTAGDFFVIVAWYTVSDGKGGTAQGDEVFVVHAQ